MDSHKDRDCFLKERYSFNTLSSEDRLASNERFLIVTADDFGYDARRDDGIIQCFQKGIVTRASLIVNGSSARTTSVQLAKENNMPLGLHINLTEGKPVSQGNSLLDENTGRLRGKFGLRDALVHGKIDMKDVKNEVNAQIQMFINLVGERPNHVDGHQHVHVLPSITDIIGELMHMYSLKQIRIPLENGLPEWFDLNREFYNSVFQHAKAAINVYNTYGISFPDVFMGLSLMGKYMSVERIIEAVDMVLTRQSTIGSTSCEFMVHPGYACVSGVGGCGYGPDQFACSPEREHESDILQQLDLRKALQERRITLIS